ARAGVGRDGVGAGACGRVGRSEAAGFFEGRRLEDEEAADGGGRVAEGSGGNQRPAVGQRVDVGHVGGLDLVRFLFGKLLAIGRGAEEREIISVGGLRRQGQRQRGREQEGSRKTFHVPLFRAARSFFRAYHLLILRAGRRHRFREQRLGAARLPNVPTTCRKHR